MQLKGSNTNILNKIKVKTIIEMTTHGILITTMRLLFTSGYNVYIFSVCGSIINICAYIYKGILQLFNKESLLQY